MNAQYTYGASKGTTADRTKRRRPANQRARHLRLGMYDNGYNNFDLRQSFNLSMLYNVPGEGWLKGGWTVGGIMNARSGLPIEVQIGRNDIVYATTSPETTSSMRPPAEPRSSTRRAGGLSRTRRRPDLVPGVDPYIQGRRAVVPDPAAFATPQPGTFGNLERT
jgi:hypothetical protein